VSIEQLAPELPTETPRAVDEDVFSADVVQPATVVDATAELLGRAKPKRTRSRTATGARKASSKRTPRPRV
jgi:hypothetical protein